MTADLRAHVDRLAVEKAERQRIEHDLDIARSIQRGLLPTTRPDLRGLRHRRLEPGGQQDGRRLLRLASAARRPRARLAGRRVGAWRRPGAGGGGLPRVCPGERRRQTTTDLGRILDRINTLLVDDMPEGRFVTFVGVLLGSGDASGSDGLRRPRAACSAA